VSLIVSQHILPSINKRDVTLSDLKHRKKFRIAIGGWFRGYTFKYPPVFMLVLSVQHMHYFQKILWISGRQISRAFDKEAKRMA